MPISTPKFKFYEANVLGIVFEELAIKLKKLKEKVCTFKLIIFNVLKRLRKPEIPHVFKV